MFGKKAKELLVPSAVKTDPDAIEFARIWAAHGSQHVSISSDVREDPGMWGVMLVDLARHVANFYEQERGMSRDPVLDRIKTLLDAEWEASAAKMRGSKA